jgi:hypothetical protein
MKKFDWIVTLILSLVTCGIYALYMFYVMAGNSDKMAEKSGVQKNSSLVSQKHTALRLSLQKSPSSS